MSQLKDRPRSITPSSKDDVADSCAAFAAKRPGTQQLAHQMRKGESNQMPMRTGFLSSFVILPTIPESKCYGRATKWTLTVVVSLAALTAPLGSNILLPVLLPISEYFNTSHTVVNLTVALYALSVAITPLWWSHMAENHGRRMVYLVTFLLLAVFNILCAVSENLAMFIIMRLLAGGACASVQAVGAGTVADLWEPQERGKAIGIFSLGPMLGPLAAPIVGAALTSRWGWRSTQWFLAIYGLAIWLAMTILLPETSTKFKASCGQSKASNKDSRRVFVRVLVSPLLSVKLLRHIPILIVAYYTSIAFAGNYLLNISIQDVFSRPPYQWPTLIVGLAYIPSSVGAALGAILGGQWTDHCMKRGARRSGRLDADGKPVFHPKDRIGENLWVAAIMYPAALLWWGWAAEKHVFWLVPLIANFFFGFAFMLISSVTTAAMTEFVPGNTTSGVAVTNLLRNTFGCLAAIIADPLISAIGNGWLFTIAFFLSLISGAGMILMKRNWERWSKEMALIRDQSN